MSRPVCARRVADEQVKPLLLEVFNANYRVYGRRKIKAALRREHGINFDKDRIARLMRELNIRGVTRSKTTITTRSDRNSPRRRTEWTDASRPRVRTSCGSLTSPTCRHGLGSRTRRSSPTCTRGRSSAGGPRRR